MRDILWIYAVIILSVSETWSLVTGTNQSIFDNSSTTPHPRVDVVKNLTFNLGTDVNLTCSDKMWNGTIYVIWKIQKYKSCEIGFIYPSNGTDSCHDGKSLQNTSSSQPYLHIPNFSSSDSGVYKCEWVYSGGIESYLINVAIRVHPIVSLWLEQRGSKTVAVCKAETGKTAANISWSYLGNQTVETLESGGFFTVISHLEIPKGMDTKNLSCTVKNQYWQHKEILGPKPITAGKFSWLWILIFLVIVFLAGFLFFARKKLVMLRQGGSGPVPSKSSLTEDVEEVEPYASYVQRVNSIYNSSADFGSHKNPAHASHAHA